MSVLEDLIGATITDAREVEQDGTRIVLDTNKGTYTIGAVAWSDVLASATDGESSDLEVHVSVRQGEA